MYCIKVQNRCKTHLINRHQFEQKYFTVKSFNKLNIEINAHPCGPALLSGELQDFLQSPPEWQPLLRLAVGDHISAPLCAQLDARPLLFDSLQPCLSDVPAEVHLYLHQTFSVCCHTLQAAVGDVDTVLQVKAAQFPAALQHRDHILVGDVSTARQGQPEQVGTPVAQRVTSGFHQREGGTSVQELLCVNVTYQADDIIV